MTTQHTPGPWTVEGHTVNARGVAYGFANSTASAHELRANARLIAAAPDMLAALHSAATVFEFLRHCQLTVGDRALLGSAPVMSAQDACYEAINKAEEG